MNLKEYITSSGEVLLYKGNPNFHKLEELAKGPGDIWHSSFEQGYKNSFPELVYQTCVFFWYINDFEGLEECVSWRINPNSFVVRKSIWEKTGGFDNDFSTLDAQALDYGFRCLNKLGVTIIYHKGLFIDSIIKDVKLSRFDRHLFYRKNFLSKHAIYMNFRLGFYNISEWITYFKVKNNYKFRSDLPVVDSRPLNKIKDTPTVSYIIPTMYRQDYTLQLLNDLSNQDYALKEVVVVDATPETERDEKVYFEKKYPFELKVIWQKSKGSCRARNEAIDECTGEYIVFGDDDVRLPSNFVSGHLQFLQTYNANACNGLDIRADHHKQDLKDLENKLNKFGKNRWKAGVTSSFSNANSCVKREFVNKLKGNDVNFDGGYGEDGDFGLSLSKLGLAVLFNPHATNLHLKPPSGGYRWWGTQAKILGKKRKTQPWELDTPVKNIKPVPSPTVMYGIMKQFTPEQLSEYKFKHFSYYLFDGPIWSFIYRLFRLPYKNLQFKKSVFYASKLIKRGIIYK